MRVPGCPLVVEVAEGSGGGARVVVPGPAPLHQPAALTLHHSTATLDQIEVNVEGKLRNVNHIKGSIRFNDNTQD